MKFIAVVTIEGPLTEELHEQIVSQELPALGQALLAGKIEHAWYREDKLGMFLLLEADSLVAGYGLVKALPLAAQGVAKFEVIPVASPKIATMVWKTPTFPYEGEGKD